MALAILGLFFVFLMSLLSSGPRKAFWTCILAAYLLIGAGFVVASGSAGV